MYKSVILTLFSLFCSYSTRRMKPAMWRLKTYLILFVLSSSACGLELLSLPASQNAYLDSTVVFTCTAIEPGLGAGGMIISWRWNGELVPTNMYFREMLNSTVIRSTLTFVANESFNNTDVTCTAFSFFVDGTHNQIESMPPGHLKLQGQLNSVNNLSVQYGAYSTIVNWSAPYTLPDLNIQYNFSITNQSYSQHIVLLNQESYVVDTVASLSSCSFYNFTIWTWNDVGPGMSANIVKWFTGKPIAPSSALLSDVIYNQFDGDVTAILTFPVTSPCFYQQNITAISKVLSQYYTSIVTSTDGVTVTILGLPLDQSLSLQLTLTNAIGNDTLTGIVIRTYDVQRVDILNTTSSSSCFQCTLMTNSSALGCYIKLVPTGSSSCAMERSVTLYSDDFPAEGCISGLYNGVYNVKVYDLEINNEINQETSKELSNVSLQGIPCPSSTVMTIFPISTSTLSPTGTSMNGSITLSNVPTVTAVDETAAGLRTAGILIGVFGIIIILAICIMVFVFIYNRSQAKGGVFTITSDRTESAPVGIEVPLDRIDGGADSPELVAVHPYKTSQVKSEYSPPREHDITMETTLQQNHQEYHDQEKYENTRNKQFVVMQLHKTVRTSRDSSTSSSSSVPISAVHVRHGSGEYDHLIGDNNHEIEHTTVPLDVVIDVKSPVHDEVL